MSALIKIANRYINLDQVKVITYFDSDNSVRVFFNDDGGSDSVNFADFFGDHAAALKDYLDDESLDIVQERATRTENDRVKRCLLDNICPNCGEELFSDGEREGECTHCTFNKWA